MTTTTWTLIHSERQALLADLEKLTPEQWATPSLCPGWTVHQVLGHIVALTTQTPLSFGGKFLASGFRFEKMAAKDVARNSAGTPAETLAAFRAHLEDTTAPPGPVDSWVGEIVVHGADIRRPLGLHYAPPTSTSVRAADFYRGSNVLIGAKDRIQGLRLVARDVEWAAGEGPEVEGDILPLVVAMTGRADALEDLSGPGVEILQRRMR